MLKYLTSKGTAGGGLIGSLAEFIRHFALFACRDQGSQALQLPLCCEQGFAEGT